MQEGGEWGDGRCKVMNSQVVIKVCSGSKGRKQKEGHMRADREVQSGHK